MQITTILLVSRLIYLDRVLACLLKQTYKSQSLIVIFDGSDEDFFEALKKMPLQQYDRVICVKSTNMEPAYAISERREHIVNMHNQIRGLISDDVDYIFSVEDDGLVPDNALEHLLRVAQYNNTGMVTGVELGRWGVQYVGAWNVDDIFEPKVVTSLKNKTQTNPLELDEIDACGLYCALVKADKYKQHEFNTTNGLGPDINLGLTMRQQGLKNYIDWGVPVTHLTNRNGVEMEIPATDNAQLVILTLLGNNVWHQAKYPFGINL